MAQQQIDELVSKLPARYIKHHGIRGMKWGVRRSDAQLSRASDAVRRANEYEPDKLYVSGKGRRARVSSGESARAAVLAGVVKKHGPSTLSNKDLEFLNKRLQLTATNTKLSPKQKSKVAKIIETAVKLDRATGNVASNAAKAAAIKFVDQKTNGKASEIMKIVDKTASKQRPKAKPKTESKDSIIDKVQAQPRKPKEVYNLETHTWEVVDA